jgi:hypothetical protein
VLALCSHIEPDRDISASYTFPIKRSIKAPRTRLDLKSVSDRSGLPHVDLAGSHMPHQWHDELTRLGIKLRIVRAHGRVRNLLQANGVGENRRARW